MIVLEGITRAYRAPRGELCALEDVSLTVPNGDFVALTGASGAGKSTLLHIIGLLDRPTVGTVWIDSVDGTKLDDDERAVFRNRHVGFVFQAFHLVPYLTLVENAALPLAYRGVDLGRRRARALEAVDRVGLAGRADHLPDELSGGEQQRAAIARALVGDPSLLLADEPTGNLDLESAGIVLDSFDGIHQGGTTVVLVTHDRDVAARAHREVHLEAGRIEPRVSG